MLPEVPGVLTADEIRLTADRIAEWQMPDGMIPWYPGGHADPWNHIEAAMALAIGERRTEAEAAYQWLADIQRHDGAWHQYYINGEVEQDKLDANVIAYVAAGTWHHFLLYRDQGFLETMWPVVSRAIDFVLDLQQPRGEILWARHPDGTPWSFALLTGSSSIAHSLRCAIAVAQELGEERPDWELSLGQLAHAIRYAPDTAFSPKHRWAMDWYYPVLSGVVSGEAGRDRLHDRLTTFLLEGEGIRCVSDRPWVTAAETCECALAFLGVGERATALMLFTAAQRLREPDGRYITGKVHPQGDMFPSEERSTYSAAAVVLTAEALDGSSPAARLFADHTFLPPIIDIDPISRDQPVRD
ncbi:MAG: prenyltransferase [Acidimicrobiaceae bacterium]|jgi:hypothetical protein|nr:prenyltransferase [Acidimicrobiaceae bacterium]